MLVVLVCAVRKYPRMMLHLFRYLNEINQTLLQIEEELGLSQIVKFPTRDKFTLELFFTNRPSLLNQCEPIPGISDHDTAVYIDSDISIKRQ
jgi:hypothetical protein